VDKEVDANRPLSKQGADEVKAMARFFYGKGLDIPEIWHSGKARAEQTAQSLQPAVALRGTILQQDGLGPKDDVKPIAKGLKGRADDLMIVGHLPFLAKLASRLLVGDENQAVVTFRNAGVVCLECDESHGWQIAWAIPPEWGNN
jgi:phosphohistidine phosphatase